MAECREDITFDCMPNSPVECEVKGGHSVLEEIMRCRELYDHRQEAKRKEALDIKPLYYDQLKKKEVTPRYPVYKYWFVYPKPKPYESCQHIGQIILDRDIFTQHEHISLLAQPKRNFQRLTRPPKCVTKKTYLTNCTTRIDSLAHPKKVRVQHNWNDFHQMLSVRQASNLRKALQRRQVETTTIKEAIAFIREDKYLRSAIKNKLHKRCDQIKRKLLRMEKRQILKIIYALYEVMKEFLINDQFAMDSADLSRLCKVIESKIIHFCDLSDTSTSHLQHLVKTVALNLAIWIEKFTSNCGFRQLHTDKQTDQAKEVEKQPDKNVLLLPVEDYIPYQSPTITDVNEFDYEEEEEDFDDEYENED